MCTQNGLDGATCLDQSDRDLILTGCRDCPLTLYELYAQGIVSVTGSSLKCQLAVEVQVLILCKLAQESYHEPTERSIWAMMSWQVLVT